MNQLRVQAFRWIRCQGFSLDPVTRFCAESLSRFWIQARVLQSEKCYQLAIVLCLIKITLQGIVLIHLKYLKLWVIQVDHLHFRTSFVCLIFGFILAWIRITFFIDIPDPLTIQLGPDPPHWLRKAWAKLLGNGIFFINLQTPVIFCAAALALLISAYISLNFRLFCAGDLLELIWKLVMF